jgi:hypothetical protein
MSYYLGDLPGTFHVCPQMCSVVMTYKGVNDFYPTGKKEERSAIGSASLGQYQAF